MNMIKINVSDVWSRLIDYYYKIVQPTEDISVWGYVEKYYKGNRTYTPERILQITFEHDSDATAFRLKFINSKPT
jgi:hypothetical protein